MLDIEIMDIITVLQTAKAEINDIEAKAAREGCPKKLYDTISSFSNKSGGVVIFGVDEEKKYYVSGVYDAADLQKKVVEQCLQMIPIVRPVFSTLMCDGKLVITAEIQEASIQDKPVYYSGAGIQKGSYIRVGDADMHMTDSEIYSLMAFKKNTHDELRIVKRAGMLDLDMEKVEAYVKIQTRRKPNFARLGKDRMLLDLGIISQEDNGVLKPTVTGLLCFGLYPQSFFPQWMVTCISVPGYEIGEIGGSGERFIDNKKIEGTIPEMIEGCISFVLKNMSVKTIISGKTGKREDKTEYPVKAIREGVLNALIHRDYSIHSEGVYVQIRMYKDRIEIQNPGGLFGRISIDLLGKKKNYDARNPNIIRILEDMEIVENRGSGIPTMIDEMHQHGLKALVFEDIRGNFIVAFFGENKQDSEQVSEQDSEQVGKQDKLLLFLAIPRTKKEISEYLGISSLRYLKEAYLLKLLEKDLIKMTVPDKPTSRNQKYVAANRNRF